MGERGMAICQGNEQGHDIGHGDRTAKTRMDEFMQHNALEGNLEVVAVHAASFIIRID